MKTNSASRAAFFNLRVLIGFVFCSIGLLRASAQITGTGFPGFIPMWTGTSTLGASHLIQNTTTQELSVVLSAADPILTCINTRSMGNGYGVEGSTGTSTGAGVLGLAALSGAQGVRGSNTNTTGLGATGVQGESNSPLGIGVLAENNATTTPGLAWGVLGITHNSTGIAVEGWASSTTGFNYGVLGDSDSSDGIGVKGIATSTEPGTAYGVYGQSANGSGVYGYSTFNTGVLGIAQPSVDGSNGVVGLNLATSGHANGVYGISNSAGGVGAIFENTAGGLILLGRVDPSANLFTVDANGSGFFAGDLQANGNGTFGPTQINGDLNVTGAITAGTKDFKIDHPLDPANKYLYHTSVESPDMLNIYNGNITTDQNGSATVELPNYFEALNRDFRYQLTVIGQFAQAVVAEEISHNHFTIRTSQPSVKVSWQVTGIRQDGWANAHRTLAEEDKPAGERGTYLYPELYGASAGKNKGAIVQH